MLPHITSSQNHRDQSELLINKHERWDVMVDSHRFYSTLRPRGLHEPGSCQLNLWHLKDCYLVLGCSSTDRPRIARGHGGDGAILWLDQPGKACFWCLRYLSLIPGGLRVLSARHEEATDTSYARESPLHMHIYLATRCIVLVLVFTLVLIP